jgi:hypothetical protein
MLVLFDVIVVYLSVVADADAAAIAVVTMIRPCQSCAMKNDGRREVCGQGSCQLADMMRPAIKADGFRVFTNPSFLVH